MAYMFQETDLTMAEIMHSTFTAVYQMQTQWLDGNVRVKVKSAISSKL
jgi:hypothetical protein